MTRALHSGACFGLCDEQSVSVSAAVYRRSSGIQVGKDLPIGADGVSKRYR